MSYGRLPHGAEKGVVGLPVTTCVMAPPAFSSVVASPQANDLLPPLGAIVSEKRSPVLASRHNPVRKPNVRSATLSASFSGFDNGESWGLSCPLIQPN